MARNPKDAWDRIRASRARPPELAATEERKPTYSAALQQFEELARAASTSGPWSRPLPLFYAAAQAGKALQAAAIPGEDWSTSSHGLRQLTKNLTPGQFLKEPMSFTLKPNLENLGALGALAKAINSDALTSPICLGELYASLPDLESKPTPAHPWARPVYVESLPEGIFPKLTTDYVRAGVAVHDNINLSELLNAYPSFKGARSGSLFEHVQTAKGSGVVLTWKASGSHVADHQNRLDEVAPLYRLSGDRWALPRLGDSDGSPRPLVRWWALLFGFSILARYEPALWAAVLHPDESVWAVPIEAALEEALRALPELVWLEIERIGASESGNAKSFS